MANIKQVFISHAKEDRSFARRLAGDIRRLGVQVWIAPESIRPGESWVEGIERGMNESSHTLIILTPAAVKSQWVKKETEVAITLERQGRMQVIPLDVKQCQIPLFLGSYQMVSFRSDYGSDFQRLAQILGLSTMPPTQVHASQSATKAKSSRQPPSKPTSWPLPAVTTIAVAVAIVALLTLGVTGISAYNDFKQLSAFASSMQVSLASQVQWPIAIGAVTLLVGAVVVAGYWQSQQK